VSAPVPAGRSGAARTIWLVTAREVAARMVNRGFLVGTLVSMVLVAGLLLVLGTPTHTHQPTVVVAGLSRGSVATAAGATVRWEESTSPAAARERVTGGHADGALVAQDGDERLYLRAGIAHDTRDTVTAAVAQWATTRALAAQHVDPDQLRRSVAAAMPPVATLDGPGRARVAPAAAVSVVTVLFFQLFGYCVMVAQGVVEEKSTRVVEVLLSTVTPLRLMVGKVFGIGVAALAQMAALALAVVATGAAGHALPARFPTVPAMVAAVVWFLLGFAFFAFLFAAAGSLVARAEDVGTAVMPVLLTMMLPFGVAVAAVPDLNASWVHVVQFVPPFSVLLMPMLVSAHAAGWLANLVAAILLVLAAWGLAALAAGVYRRSILRTGGRLRWREARTIG
jgi:ABC-2 type transport system permease protein